MGLPDFLQRVWKSIRRDDLLHPGDGVVVAVSGGVDSVVLLHALHRINAAESLGWDLHAAHLNHRLRGEEADADERFVRRLAESLDLPCTVQGIDLPLLGQGRAPLSEDAARRCRYDFLERVCIQTGFGRAALGHHADDNAETILHRILRGTGVRGLGGIQPVRPFGVGNVLRVIRPLLRIPRAELERFAAENDIQHRVDASNASEIFTRNRIRRDILPLLAEQVNAQVVEALLRLGEQARWMDEFLRETTGRVFETLIVRRTDQELVLNLASLLRKSRIIQTELLRMAVESFELDHADIGFGHLQSVLELAHGEASGKQATLPGGLTVRKAYERLIFVLDTTEPREDICPEVALHVPGSATLPVRRLRIDVEVFEADYERFLSWRETKTPDVEWLDFDKVCPPLIVRSRMRGDRFYPLGSPGSKSLADFLGDNKVDRRERDRVAVICDQLGPIWVAPFRIDERVKLTRNTRKVLQIRIHPLQP